MHAWLAGVGQAARREFTALAVLAAFAGGVWAVTELSDEVVEGDTRRLDRALLLAMRTSDPADPVGPGWLEELGRDFTALGGVGVLTLITICAFVYLLLDRKRRAALLLLAASGGGLVFSSLLKWFFERPRPDLVPHESIVYTASFPSGHSMMAAVTYLTIGALLARTHGQKRFKAFFFAIAVVLTVLVGISRVYLGVHWPTDVLAGWAMGALWALAVWLLAYWLQRRGEVERA